MIEYDLTLTSVSDVSPAANRERGFVTPAYPYVPGGTLRGALAALWIARFGDPDNRMAEFTREIIDLRVGPAVVSGTALRPLSVFACKYPRHEACARVWDAAFEELPQRRLCPGCGGALAASKGQWEGPLRRTSRSRTALTEQGTPQAGSLFSRGALAADQRFLARAQGDLSWLDSQQTIRVGGQRSVAGKMTVSASPHTPAPADAVERLVVRLDSPAVFLAEDGRTRLSPQPGDLRRAGLPESLVLEASWTRPDTVGGWNAAGGLPKSSEVVAVAGSTYVLRGKVTDQQVGDLRERGLGARRVDGLGWIDLAAGAWSPPTTTEASRQRRPQDKEVGHVADTIEAIRDSGQFRRQVLGWLRQGYTDELHPPGYSYDGLTSHAKVAASRALSMRGLQRQALVVVLDARDSRLRGEGTPHE